jgi:hypothetical protein
MESQACQINVACPCPCTVGRLWKHYLFGCHTPVSRACAGCLKELWHSCEKGLVNKLKTVNQRPDFDG